VVARLSVSSISILCVGTSDIRGSCIVKSPEEELYEEVPMPWVAGATEIGRDSRSSTNDPINLATTNKPGIVLI
jgi:hypothetical protein